MHDETDDREHDNDRIAELDVEHASNGDDDDRTHTEAEDEDLKDLRDALKRMSKITV